MARDYKNAGTRHRGGRSGSGFTGVAGLALGLTLGIALASAVHLYHTHPDRQSSVGTEPTEPATGQAATPASGEQRARPRFDFYRMLPNYEVVIPEEDIAVTPARVQEQVANSGN
ncbi:MAG: hypothetical protein LC632_02590 [Xanthomonadaceae bacterium]|nr:hypothetical protein [Xanthomonadaceae bacterium]